MNQPRKTAVESVDQIRAAIAGGPGQPIYPMQGNTPPPLYTPPPAPPGTPQQGTMMENVAGGWQAPASYPQPVAAPGQYAQPPAQKPAGSASMTGSDADCTPFRPINRPSMAVLVICDDGRKEGEVVRLRATSTVIGRAQGEILIPHDDAISSRHAELVRQLENGRHRWYLRDLGSRNGTYVRAAKALLRPNQEILIGSHRYRFQPAAVKPEAQQTPPQIQQTQTTRGWQAVSAGDIENMFPSLVEETPMGPGGKFALSVDEMWIGSDPQQCSLVIPDDPFVSPRHAKIVNKGGQWMILNAQSTNGLWMRIESIPIEQECEFQLGEQRFFLRLA